MSYFRAKYACSTRMCCITSPTLHPNQAPCIRTCTCTDAAHTQVAYKPHICHIYTCTEAAHRSHTSHTQTVYMHRCLCKHAPYTVFPAQAANRLAGQKWNSLVAATQIPDGTSRCQGLPISLTDNSKEDSQTKTSRRTLHVNRLLQLGPARHHHYDARLLPLKPSTNLSNA